MDSVGNSLYVGYSHYRTKCVIIVNIITAALEVLGVTTKTVRAMPKTCDERKRETEPGINIYTTIMMSK